MLWGCPVLHICPFSLPCQIALVAAAWRWLSCLSLADSSLDWSRPFYKALIVNAMGPLISPEKKRKGLQRLEQWALAPVMME